MSDRFVNTGLNLLFVLMREPKPRAGGGTKLFCGQFVQKKSYVNEKKRPDGGGGELSVHPGSKALRLWNVLFMEY